MDTLFEQGSKSHGLTKSPIGSTSLDHLHAGLEDALETSVDDELGSIGWGRGEALADVNEGVLLDAGGADLEGVLALEEARPGRVEPVLVLDVCLLAGVGVSVLADLLVFVGDVLDLVGGDGALLDQLLSVKGEAGLSVLDLAVHQRLGEHGLVDFVVTVASVRNLKLQKPAW
jgi:hypothetical protein